MSLSSKHRPRASRQQPLHDVPSCSLHANAQHDPLHAFYCVEKASVAAESRGFFWRQVKMRKPKWCGGQQRRRENNMEIALSCFTLAYSVFVCYINFLACTESSADNCKNCFDYTLGDAARWRVRWHKHQEIVM